tara:strand:- start:709 stop:1959 length:1251 start_codon:yes stop_codon:yes gene_type:complete
MKKHNPNVQVAVVGAGIIGTVTSFLLQKQGLKVTLFDHSDPGSKTSFGNAGTFANYACIPINSEKIFSQLPQLILGSDSPLSIEWSSLLQSFPWLIKFLRNCRKKKVEEIINSLGSLLRMSDKANNEILQDRSINPLIKYNEALYVYDNIKDYEDSNKSNQLREKQGVRLEVLDENEINNLEPSLSKKFYKGIIFKNSYFTSDPLMLTQKIFDNFISAGGVFVKTKIKNIGCTEHGVYLSADEENISFDKIVLATGAWTKYFSNRLGDKIPLGVERGYHLMYANSAHKISRPIGINAYGFYMTPMTHGLRVAGTVEIGSANDRVSSRRISWMKKKSKEIINTLEEPSSEWVGHRPTLPDSLPVLGPSLQNPNIYYNFGHQHLGLTLAALSGKIIRDMVIKAHVNYNVSAFSPQRFT